MFQDDYGFHQEYMTQKSVREVIAEIVEDWFLLDPVLFAVSCTHTFEENDRLCIPMRSGKMKVEYCPQEMQGWGRNKIERRLKAEMVRILLLHPYQRQLHGATKAGMMLTSDITVKDLYSSLRDVLSIPQEISRLPSGLCFEEYYPYVQEYLDRDMKSPPYDKEGISDDGGGGSSDDENLKKNGKDAFSSADSKVSEGEDQDDAQEPENKEDSKDADGANPGDSDMDEDDGSSGGRDIDDTAFNGMTAGGDGAAGVADSLIMGLEQGAELWEEDQLVQEQMREVINKAEEMQAWGSLPGGLIEKIIASAKVKMDYRRIISMFRASVLSSMRHLTRMRPSRRYGFQYMGSKRDFSTRLLVAVDVSGSVSSKQISKALSIVNRFFKYGIESIDVIQFDYGLTGEKVTMKKAVSEIRVTGRGGTDFQAAVDVFVSGRYDGLIFITDGYALEPELPEIWHGSILWMLYEEPGMENGWIRKFRRSRYIVIPR